MTTKANHTAISIYMDGVWAGSGRLADDGSIVDCSAQFCDDNERSLAVYEEIEDAIDVGDDSLEIELDGEAREITWTITYGNAHFSGDSEYIAKKINGRWSVQRGDGCYATFDSQSEAEQAAEKLIRGEVDDREYDWVE